MRSLTKRQKDLTLLVLSIIFFAVIAAYSWYRMYAPAKEDNARVVSSLADQREVLFELQRQLAAKPEDVSSSSRPLQQKVPVIPLEELLVVQLEKAEVKSGAAIRDVQFTKDDAGLEMTDPAATPDETTDGTAIDAAAESPEAALRRVTIDVELSAESYKSIDRFIREVEQMGRIFIVQTIELTPPDELLEQTEEAAPLELTVSFQAFYRPDLTGLLPDVPKLDAPDPAGKEDPTARAGEEDSE
ncbi:hypothetical protein NCCP2716_12840 [Sporosarcina sp. NCCP-2716]|uniref:hypothetical protein n=1 Tax=Sporosarcina sp. NCCP-2716 TaxID=2943679 RepID=UPI00203B8554|nr:hypothetical protein [Sporosarcina sp. NCCP-2716]GKV68786.1 hypothetical protein NCCP2716_12840 [Sporosarcina sp. NCCP-2716]